MGSKKGENGPHDYQRKHPNAGGSNDQIVDLDNLEDSLEIEDKYTEGEEDEVASNVILQRHPNRNTNKPDIDKPPYS